MVPVFSFFNWGGGLLDPNSKKEMLSHERVFPSSLWSKAVHCLAKRHGLEQRLWICLYKPALSPAFCYISVYQCGQIAVQEPVRPFQDPAVRLYRWHWLHGSWDLSSPGLRPPYSLWWIDDIVQTLVGGDYILQAFSAGEVFSRHSVFYLYFMCVCLVCNCFWFSLNKLQLPSLQGILRRIGHSIKIATSNLWALYYCKITSLQPL